MIIKQYKYSSSALRSLLSALLFGGIVYVGWQDYLDENAHFKSLRFLEPYHLGSFTGRELIWLFFTWAAAMISICALFQAIFILKNPDQKIVFENDYFIFPKTLYNPRRKIPYENILSLEVTKVKKTNMATVKTKDFLVRFISGSFESEQKFEEALQFLREKSRGI